MSLLTIGKVEIRMNYIVTQVARPKENKVPQMQSSGVRSVDSAVEVYLKNAVVSLASAKISNPDAVCILNCDFAPPDWLASVAEQAKIQIHQVPSGTYRSREEFSWAVTQYKFDSMGDVLGHMEEGDCLVLLDSDTVCVRGMEEVFEEAAHSLVLYPVCHGYAQEKRQSILRNYQRLCGMENRNLVHYGGEFFAGSKATLEKLLDACGGIVEEAQGREDLEAWDDEHVLSIAVERFLKESVYPASPYICRYWTNQFYLVSTNYYYDPVYLWHLPAEKNYGMLVLYDYFAKCHRFPDVRKMAKIMGLPGTAYQRWNPYRLKMRLKNKLKCCGCPVMPNLLRGKAVSFPAVPVGTEGTDACGQEEP